MKTVLLFALILMLSSACSEKAISPESALPTPTLEDVQPPKSNCTGGPDCH